VRCASAGAERPECGLRAGPAYVVIPQAEKKAPWRVAGIFPGGQFVPERAPEAQVQGMLNAATASTGARRGSAGAAISQSLGRE
jgi:hypothetical protein